jgi:microcystin-dependent protein
MIAAVVAVMLAAPTVLSGVAWGGANPFLGEIEIVGFNFAPIGWATCDGQLLPISQNTALFALLGTQYGGNGQTTFALPDLRGRVAIHQGQGPGLTNRIIGETGGSESVTLNSSQIPAHTHGAVTTVNVAATLKAQSGNGSTQNPGGNALAVVPRGLQYSPAAPNVSMNAGAIATTASATTTIGTTGSNAPLPVENMPPYLVVNYIIALQGIFPSRN